MGSMRYKMESITITQFANENYSNGDPGKQCTVNIACLTDDSNHLFWQWILLRKKKKKKTCVNYRPKTHCLKQLHEPLKMWPLKLGTWIPANKLPDSACPTSLLIQIECIPRVKETFTLRLKMPITVGLDSLKTWWARCRLWKALNIPIFLLSPAIKI